MSRPPTRFGEEGVQICGEVIKQALAGLGMGRSFHSWRALGFHSVTSWLICVMKRSISSFRGSSTA
jgi:hypothetical protein